MTARDERVVWTVPGAASDPPDSAVNRFGSQFLPSLSSFVFARGEGDEGS